MLRYVTIPLTQASKMLGHLIDDARISGQPIAITRSGRVVAMLVPVTVPAQRTDTESIQE